VDPFRFQKPGKWQVRVLAGFLAGSAALAGVAWWWGGFQSAVVALFLSSALINALGMLTDWRVRMTVRRVHGHYLDLERRLDRQLDVIGDRLGLDLRDELAEGIRDRLAKEQPEMALIEYRRARGAALGLTFEAAADYPEASLERKLDAILSRVEERLGVQPPAPPDALQLDPTAIRP
jgi:hypothetical protein